MSSSPGSSYFGSSLSFTLRGRGRGRGGFGYGRFARQEKYEVFPEIDKLHNVNLKQKDEELTQKDKELKQKYKELNSVHTSLIFQTVGKNVRPIKKKNIQWDLQSDLQKLDIFEKLDQDQDEEKKEDEDEDEDMENIEEEVGYEDDDYAQNQDFDDDEDDFNMNDDFGDGMQNHCTVIDVNGKKMSPKKSAFDEGCY
ncbi:hypothetical protein L2E82_45811 [Cichorium intybus]|uniref:Uncharacterized protein n=1 Tax=Cichorium intybus TaxID=13427 RepID=A0ACB8ZTZ3_CICIN|nr:hypothetical protein L2E82_45811 [Cichorium intybus]